MSIPFPDESVIANLDNVISIFKQRSSGESLTEEDLRITLEELNQLKQTLEEINSKTLKDAESVRNLSQLSRVSTELQPRNEIMRNSIEMLSNNGKFVKPIDQIDDGKPKKDRNSSIVSARSFIHYCPSDTSLRNSMTISPCSFTKRKSPPKLKLLTPKLSRQNLQKQADKKLKNISVKQKQELAANKAQKVVSTLYAKCRIHSYEDNSHTFEIIKPNRVNCHGDDNEKSEIVFCVLANGQSALFTSKRSKSFIKLLSSSESQ